MDADISPSLQRFRTALRFSLWMWAAYWPGGGLLLLIGGLDPISIIVTFGSLTTFIVLVMMGGLKADSSRSMKEFLLERPIYVIAAFLVLLMVVPFFSSAENIGLRLFSLLWFASIVLITKRLVDHQASLEGNIFATKNDQAFVVLGLMVFASLIIMLDAWLPVFGGGATPATDWTVIVCNWVNLLYPPLLMLATRTLRTPLQWPRRRREPVPESTGDAVPLEA